MFRLGPVLFSGPGHGLALYPAQSMQQQGAGLGLLYGAQCLLGPHQKSDLLGRSYDLLAGQFSPY